MDMECMYTSCSEIEELLLNYHTITCLLMRLIWPTDQFDSKQPNKVFQKRMWGKSWHIANYITIWLDLNPCLWKTACLYLKIARKKKVEENKYQILLTITGFLLQCIKRHPQVPKTTQYITSNIRPSVNGGNKLKVWN